MNQTKTATPQLVIRRTFAFPRDRVYKAWTDSQEMIKWSGPTGFTVPEFTSDGRVGGAYRMKMISPEGEALVVHGIYREIDPPKRVSYTWRWEEESPADEVESLVTVEFNERGGGTELVLTHAGLANEDSVRGHEGGWGQALDKLGAYLAAA